MRITFLWTQVISRTLFGYTKTGRNIDYLIDGVQPPSVSGTDNNGTLSSYVHELFAAHPKSSSHMQMWGLVHGSMLSLS